MSRAEPAPRLPSPTPNFAPVIRPLQASDRAPLAELISRDGLFLADEVTCALELIDAALANPGADYLVRVADVQGRIAGYVCFGPTPMTSGTWDLYWIATHPEFRGRGIATFLIQHMERELRARDARLVRVETSHLDAYGSAHRFYVRTGYPEVARLPDFYRPGEDLIIMLKRL